MPVTLRELLDLLGALEKNIVFASWDDFYSLTRIVMVKDEAHYDRFDRAFADYFKGVQALDLFNEVGMDALRQKSIQLTSYLEYHINNLNNPNVEIISPKDPMQRGCQLSIRIKNTDKTLHEKLTKNNVISDWREPGVIRFAPVPFYNSFEDVFRMITILKTLLK